MTRSLSKKGGIFLLITIVLLTSIFIIPPQSVQATGTTYYVDAVNGNDTNNGISTSAAWKTLTKVNSMTFGAGDKILFKAGGVWTGQLWPKGSGTSGNPIIIDMYGTGNKPTINGNGTTYPANISGAVMLYNTDYIEVNNLEVTNDITGATSVRSGIVIFAGGKGTLEHAYIRNCYVHDVNNSSSVFKPAGGITFVFSTYDKDGTNTGVHSRFNDILVENCTIKNVSMTGIRNAGLNPTGVSRPDSMFDSNIVFRNNYLENIGGDGIVIQTSTPGSKVEYNTANAFCNKSVGNLNYAGIWASKTNGTIFQYNEAYGGIYGYNDGEAFDIDLSCDGVIYQYNYSHNNNGGFCLFMGNSTNGIFRYNISENDGSGSGQEIFHYLPSSSTYAPKIYNNTIYIGSGKTTKIFNSSTTNKYFLFYNNIIKSDGTVSQFNNTGTTNGTFSNNCFYPSTIDDVNGPSTHSGLVNAEPKLVSPGAAGTGMANTVVYKLQSTSPCINAGITVANNGGRDFWGNSLYNGTPDIGCHEYEGTIQAPTAFVTSEDSYVRDGSYAGTNYGTATSMTVKTDAVGYSRKSYIKYDFGTYNGSSTTSARVRLYVPNVNTDTNRVVKVYGVSETWTEAGVTWNNAPQAGTYIGSINISNVTGLWYELDVTNYLNSHMQDKIVSFLLINEAAASSKNDVTFNTREASSNKPELIIY